MERGVLRRKQRLEGLRVLTQDLAQAFVVAKEKELVLDDGSAQRTTELILA